ncbi:MAG TPA: hypothetical protein VGZ01_10385, partial [Trinickia sp.]|nr:hypothetical protein [Trinickia sp.]
LLPLLLATRRLLRHRLLPLRKRVLLLRALLLRANPLLLLRVLLPLLRKRPRLPLRLRAQASKPSAYGKEKTGLRAGFFLPARNGQSGANRQSARYAHPP